MTFKELEQLYQDTQTELADYVIEVSQSERLTVAEKVEKINAYTNKTLSKLGKATEGLDLEINKEYERAVKQQTEALAKRLADAGIDKDIVDVLDENGEINLEALKSNVSMNLNSALNGAKQSVSTIASANRLSTAMEETLAKVQSIEEIAQRLSNGIPAVQYLRSNTVVEVSLGGYAKMVLNDLGVTLDDIASINVAQANGYDLVLMSSHYGTCPICQPYQGRVFSLTGNTKDYPYLYDTGWSETYQNFHPNCRHYLMPFVEDMYSQEELEKYKEFSNRSFEIGGEGWTKAQVDQANRSINAYRKDQARKQRIYNNKKQFKRYQARLGDAAPKTFASFMSIKSKNGEAWRNLHDKYIYAGIDIKIKANYPDYKTIPNKNSIPKNLGKQVAELKAKADSGDLIAKERLNSIKTYTDKKNYCKDIQTYAVSGKLPTDSSHTESEISSIDKNLNAVLNEMNVGENIIVFRGTKTETISGLDELIDSKLNIKDWYGQELGTKAYTSTTVLEDKAYEGYVQVRILIPKDMLGTTYIGNVSLAPEEYEILLNKDANYSIIDARRSNKKLFLTMELTGFNS